MIEKATITITEETKDLEFWTKEVQNFFFWKHELLEEYMKRFPLIKEKFLESKKISEIKYAHSSYRPASIQVSYPDRKGYPKN